MIEADQVTVYAGARALLDRASVHVNRGEVLAVVGPNGAGKTTLLSVLAGDRRADAGVARIAGRNVRAWTPAQLAQVRAVMRQHAHLAFDLTALQVVRLGCTPHPRTRDASDLRTALHALAAAGAAELRDRSYQTLSGGEQQRVQLARALAQLQGEDRCLLLDEPTASLDLEHQHTVLRRARALARDGAAVLAVLHDINLAARYADRVAVLAAGRVIACAPPADALTPDTLARAFRVQAFVEHHAPTNSHVVITAPGEHRAAIDP